jgi:hypothetical protein
MTEVPSGCGSTAAKVITSAAMPKAKSSQAELEETKEEPMSMARVGGPAPDFQAEAYHKGKFVSVKLSDFKGKWMLLCFYPGDFTFV